ncbi:hypothetical protein ACI65C_008394 [Semiaphis heraclei]
MSRWIIINFIQDNSVEAVPDSWAFKGQCAWPKNARMVKKLIEKRIKPNKSDFLFLAARKVGNQSYNLSKSNQSSVSNPNKSTKDTNIDLLFECNDSNGYDSDNDPVWTMECIDNDKPNNILLTSPYSSTKLSQFETNNNKNNHEVKQNSDDDQTTNQQLINSPSGMWSVEKMIVDDNYTAPKINDELSTAKKCIFKERTVAEEILDLKSYLIKTLTQIRYRIDGIETVVQTNNLNIEKLLDLRNNFEPSSISAEQLDF